jgi:hypothetical protein
MMAEADSVLLLGLGLGALRLLRVLGTRRNRR